MKITFACLWTLLFLAGNVLADVVTLKNGDRITGTLVSIKGGTLQLKSETLGTLNIPMANVATYTTEKPVAVVIKGEKPVEGRLELTPSGDWQVTSDGRTQTIAAAKADTIMPADVYQSLVVVTPKPWQAWKGAASLGDSIQHGDQTTNTVTTTVNMVHERAEAPIFKPHLRTNFNFAGLFSHAGEDSNTVTSRTLASSLRQDVLITPHDFIFGLGQFEHISTQGLYLRQTYGGGFGTDVIQNSRTTISLTGGMTYQHEKFITGTWAQNASLLLGEKIGEQLTKRMRIDHNLTFYPNLSDLGEYRFDSTTALNIKLINRVSFNASLIDLFLSNPPPGHQRNNVTFSTGIGYAF